MGSLGPTALISVLLAVAVVAAICGYIASAVARRNKRRARGYMVAGFFCGLVAGTVLRRKRQRLNALGAVTRYSDTRSLRAVIRRGANQLPRRMLTPAASHGRPASWPMNSRAALIAGRWRRMR